MPAVLVCTCDTREIEAEGTGFQGQPYLYSKFEANLVYTRPERNKDREREKEKEQENC